jgi:alanyl-tRNA synthetase
MNIDELRSSYLRFFEERGHKLIPSSSLIPHGDPTLLLTNAGMVQFKPYFMGEAIPSSVRATTCQKCFRTSDIEYVGDPNHCTFFEMLGNFSFGDYFKKEAINWAWEYVTKVLGLPKEKLWITIYLDDEEAFGYWRKLNVSEDRIVRLGEDSNFWGPAGDSGPCGPCSEIHYDFGKDPGCTNPDCKPGCNCSRFSEIWNLVFNQFYQDKEGHRTPLQKPGIDTGMGMERTLCVVQNKRTIYETDAFVPLLNLVSRISGKKYGIDAETDRAMRIATEHSRGIPFLIADGVLPGNEGRGYVLRRLLRRATLFGLRLGLDKPFLTQTAILTMQSMSHVYPELVQRKDFILKVIEAEERKFSESLRSGLEIVENILGKLQVEGKKQISGLDAFRLYDTYGFPVELTGEIAAGRGFTVDLDGFKQEMEKQREKARTSHHFELLDKGMDLGQALGVEETGFVGYNSLTQKTVILGILIKDELVDSVTEGQEVELILESTPFYGEMGGQLGDTGLITGDSGRFSVADAVRFPLDIIIHKGKMEAGILSVGDEVQAEVDEERRLDIARNHTATHLLQAALRQVLGEHIQQRGSLVAPERLRFDFSHLIPMTGEEIKKTNRLVNEMIRQNLPVFSEELPYKKAVEEGAIALFGEKYGDVVRLLRVGRPPVSAELCGGTHIKATGDIGFFRIISESSIGASLRRIEAVTGRGAEEYFEKQFNDLNQVAAYLETEPEHMLEKAQNIAQDLKNERKRALTLERELSRLNAESLLTQVETVNGLNVLVGKVPPVRVEVLREMCDWLRDQLKSVVIVLGTVNDDRPLFLATVTPDLIAKGYNAGDIIRQVAKVTGGGGGGKPNLAQAGGKDKEKINEALGLVKDIIRKTNPK